MEPKKLSSMLPPQPEPEQLYADEHAPGTIMRVLRSGRRAVCVEIAKSPRGRYWQVVESNGVPTQSPCTSLEGTIEPEYGEIDISGDNTAGCVFETAAGERFLSVSSEAFPERPVDARPNAISVDGTHAISCGSVIGRWLQWLG